MRLGPTSLVRTATTHSKPDTTAALPASPKPEKLDKTANRSVSNAIPPVLNHLVFHLTLLTHLTHFCTSSRDISLSTLAHSRASSSLPATECT